MLVTAATTGPYLPSTEEFMVLGHKLLSAPECNVSSDEEEQRRNEEFHYCLPNA
jgi:hypothetical protein